MYAKNLWLERLQLALLDGLMVFGALHLAVWLRHGWGWLSRHGTTTPPWSEYLLPGLLLALLLTAVFRMQGLYSLNLSRLREALLIAKTTAMTTVGVAALTFFYRGYSYSRATVLIFLPLCIVLLIVARQLYRTYSRAVLSNRGATRRVLIVGFGKVGRHLGRALLDNPSYYRLVGFLDDDPEKQSNGLDDARVLGTTADLAAIVGEQTVDEVILAIPSASQQKIMEWIGECLRLRVGWKAVPNLCDMMLERMNLDDVAGVPLIGFRGSNIHGFDWALKRSFDLAFASLTLLLTAPLFALIALLIKTTSRGPVFFRQERVGFRGRPFTLLKFRSMRASSGTQTHQDYSREWIYGRSGDSSPRSVGAAAAVHKMTRDPRVTRVGRWLRKTSLDELPQFWNVLRGEMSVVGPRPPLAYEVRRYTEWHKRRLDVHPGITGLWQVSGRNSLSFDEMVRLDIRYIESWSLELDVKIVLRTLPALLFGKAH